jgi:hypothetical protein
MQQPPTIRGYASWATRIAELARAVEHLEGVAAELGVAASGEGGWHGQLFDKLRPQVEREAVLVAAVCGGTNTGKSLIANALVGLPLSRSIQEASRTRHPVASVPAGLLARCDPGELFPGFMVRIWSDDDDAIDPSAEHRLIVRPETTGRQPERLVILDTPDIDGTLQDNWQRAELVRNAADLLVAVLTQQKYNDAAVCEFFTDAARAGKLVVVIFNMLEWPAQRGRLPGWLETFTTRTGVRPAAVYAIPWDREAAEAAAPRFHEIFGRDEGEAAVPPLSGAELVARLAESDFDRIKLRAMEGSLRVVVDPESGLPAWLAGFEATAEAWGRAREQLAEGCSVELELPAVPRELVWREVWAWLEPKRSRLDLAVSGFYRFVGGWLAEAGRRVGLLAEPGAKATDYAAEELSALKTALGDFLDRLDILARDNPKLEAVLGPLLASGDRGAWFAELAARHAAMPLVSADYTAFVRGELDRFEQESPGTVRLILTALNLGAVVRPAVTVGLGLAGAAAVPPAAAAAGGLSVLVHQVGDVVVGAAASLAGEGAIEATSAGIKPLLERLFAGWAAERGDLLAATIRDVVLGDAVELVEARAAAGRRPEVAEAGRLVAELAADLPEEEVAA